MRGTVYVGVRYGYGAMKNVKGVVDGGSLDVRRWRCAEKGGEGGSKVGGLVLSRIIWGSVLLSED